MWQRFRQAWRFPILEAWERNLFRAFLILCLISIPPALSDTVQEEGLSGSGLTVVVLGILQGYFFLFGIFVFGRRHKLGLIRTRRMARTFFIISLIIGVLVTLVLVGLIRALETDRLGALGIQLSDLDMGEWQIQATPDGVDLAVGSYPALVAGLFLFSVLGFFITFWILAWMAFGLCWLLSVLVRALIPDVLRGITDITPTMASPLAAVDKRLFGYSYSLRWLFHVPDVLDTRQLTIRPQEPRAAFPWPVYWHGLRWQAALSAILGVNIGLNPIFLEGGSSLAERMTLANSVSVLIPVAVLLWFVFERLNIAIYGPARNFTLYEGLRARTNGAILTFGSLVLFVRLALRQVELGLLLGSLAGYFIQIMTLNALITYVYFNYFERWLIAATAGRLAVSEMPSIRIDKSTE